MVHQRYPSYKKLSTRNASNSVLSVVGLRQCAMKVFFQRKSENSSDHKIGFDQEQSPNSHHNVLESVFHRSTEQLGDRFGWSPRNHSIRRSNDVSIANYVCTEIKLELIIELCACLFHRPRRECVERVWLLGLLYGDADRWRLLCTV